MTKNNEMILNLTEIYRGYIACLNAQDWDRLGEFVHDEAKHNGRSFGLAGYRAMLENDFREIPDLKFNIGMLIVENLRLAARLDFDCTPRGTFFNLPINGRKVAFAEHVFYEFRDGKIIDVWSVIDTAAIQRQL